MTDPSLAVEDETLNVTIARAAADWSEDDLLSIITLLQVQRDRWNVEQAAGSRKRVTSKTIKKPKSKAVQLAAGLKKLRL